MLSQIEGSRGVAEAVARCRPEVVSAGVEDTHLVVGIGAGG
jgi:hypothetical protein